MEGEGWKGRGGRGGVEGEGWKGEQKKRSGGGERDNKEGIGEVKRRWRNGGNIAYTRQYFVLSV